MPSLHVILFTPLGWALRHRRSGEEHSVLSRPGWDAPATIVLTSDAFEPGSAIPDRYSAPARGRNISPHLRWSGVPAQARQLLLVFEDLDSPMNRPGLHTIGLLAPTVTQLAEGELAPGHATIRWVPIPTHGGVRTGYAGPAPLPGHGTHHYWFHLLALDQAIPPEASLPGVDALDPYVAGHVLARGTLEGRQHG